MGLAFKDPELAGMKLSQTIPTPWGEMRVVGLSGFDPNYDHVTVAPIEGQVDWNHLPGWSVKNGWETEAERKHRVWDETWEGLDKAEKTLVCEMVPEVQDETKKYGLKSPERLVTVGLSRAIKQGKIQPAVCGRCGGSGHYSYNQIDGTRCFGCHGSGKKYPSVKNALKEMGIKVPK